MSEAQGGQHPQISIEKELRQSYLEYSLSVIIGRAIPDARDGLKPVHRRIMFAQYELANNYNRPHKKSARIVGDVMTPWCAWRRNFPCAIPWWTARATSVP